MNVVADFHCSALYLKNDPYETTDAVFGVKDPLVVEVQKANEQEAQQHGVKAGAAVIKYDFVLVTEEEAARLRQENAEKAMASSSKSFRLADGVPIPDVD